MNLVVYSCVIGHYDNARHILDSHTESGIRYVLFSETLLPSSAGRWEICGPQWTHLSPRRTSRFHKINAHILFPKADFTVWIDGNFQIKHDAQLYDLAQLMPTNFDVMAFKHPKRRCIYEELQSCIRLKKDVPQIMQEQVGRYKAEGYPICNGLVETGCLVRRHNPHMGQFNAAWWSEIAGGSVRDQLSFNYVVAQRLNFDIRAALQNRQWVDCG